MPDNPVFESDEPEMDRQHAQTIPASKRSSLATPANGNGHYNLGYDHYKDVDIELKDLTARRSSRVPRPSANLDQELAIQDRIAKDPWSIPELTPDDGPAWSGKCRRRTDFDTIRSSVYLFTGVR